MRNTVIIITKEANTIDVEVAYKPKNTARVKNDINTKVTELFNFCELKLALG